ncbi:MAG: GTPase HflX [Bacteroidales bacterium]|jgi:GTP-binding protein HflX|nr:GTPase HflX [Bacteroidales bacterium]
MGNYYVTARKAERAVLVGVAFPWQEEEVVADYLEELAFLVETAGARAVKKFIQRMEAPNPRTFIGQGKVNEIRAYIDFHQVDLVVFDDELSPTQLRNLDRELGRKVLDRTNLILDIFAQRAHTAYAKAQVELAQYEYLLPRLARMWTHLERQRGGIGLRGPGEKEIETDRRAIRNRIANLKEELKRIDRQMATQRKNRGRLVRVSLVGYTNVGKSTLMNLLAKADVFAENKLFATVDPTVRKVVIKNLPFLLSDTVGFIRKLPHSLVESFKSTLDEVRESDILLHVVDLSHPGYEEQIAIVQETLKEIQAGDKKMIMVFNKIDAYKPEDLAGTADNPGEPAGQSMENLQKMWIARENAPAVFISALKKQNIETLKELLYREVKEIHRKRYPYDNFLYPDIETLE